MVSDFGVAMIGLVFVLVLIEGFLQHKYGTTLEEVVALFMIICIICFIEWWTGESWVDALGGTGED